MLTPFRVFNTRSMILFYLVGLKLSEIPLFTSETAIVVVIFVLTYAYASIINFLEDKEIDKRNQKTNPFMQSTPFTKRLLGIAYVCAFFSILLSMFSSNKLVNIAGTLAILGLGYIYSKPPLKLSFHPLGKLLSMGLTYAYVPAFMGLMTGPGSNHSPILLFLLCSLHVSWLPYSDIKDMVGDKEYGKRTLAIHLGLKKLLLVCASASSICIISLIPFLPKGTGALYALLCLYSLALAVQFYFVFNQKTVHIRRLQIFGGYLILASLLLFLIM